MLPEPWLIVMIPTGNMSMVAQSWVPLGRFTFLTLMDRMLKPPQPLNWVSLARAVPVGVWPLMAGPVSASLSLPPVWQAPPGLGAGGGDGERERPGNWRPGRVGHGHREGLRPEGGGRAEQQPGGPQGQPGGRLPGPGVRGCAAGRLEESC